jgi:predicted homoserine dehydrogenase-like protein
MIYRQLIEQFGAGKVVRAGVIGTGHYATAVITQAQVIPQLEVPVVCDRDIEAARRACRHAGISDDDMVICDNRQSALAALETGKQVILADAMLMMDLPLDVVVESTGVPEASAVHAAAAIRQGKHVAMVSKEGDASVGPILKYQAERAGLVYTAVDGDQHGLLMALVQWVQGLGLDVICGGKALDSELIFEETTVSRRNNEVYLSRDDRVLFASGPPAETRQYVQRRRDILGDFASIAGYDVVEMTIAANATGLQPDIDELHCPIVRIPEIPEVLAPAADGGFLQRSGVIDSVICLRGPHEAGLGGGVFVVVGCDNDYSRYILTTKGLISNSTGTTALIFRPYHLCGVETPVSLLAAGLLGLATGAVDYQPHYDVVVCAAEDLKAGERVGNDHSKNLKALMRPAQPVRGSNPVPLHMANGNVLAVDVPAGTVLTADMLQKPENSTLWTLRAEQDRVFLKA